MGCVSTRNRTLHTPPPGSRRRARGLDSPRSQTFFGVQTLSLGIVLLVGFIGHNHYGERVIQDIDLAIASIPGVGTVYRSFRRMGDVMLHDALPIEHEGDSN